MAPRQGVNRSRGILLLLLLGCTVAASTFQLRQVYRIIPARWSDLYPQWTGVKAALHGENPYSQTVTDQIEQGMYGHVLQPEEKWDRQRFVYPAHLIFLLGPATVLPWWLVRLLFSLLAPPAIAATLWIWLRVLGLRLGPWQKIALYVLTLGSWPAIWAYQQTQPTILISLLIALGVLLFRQGRDFWSGLMVALATTKPNLVGLVALWLAYLALRDRRWKWIASAVLWTAALAAATELVVPGWISEWLRTVRTYAHDPQKQSLLVRFSWHYGAWTTLAAGALVCLCLWKRRAVAVDSEAFGGAVAMLLAFTVCAIPTTGWMIYNELLLIPCVVVLIQKRSAPGPGIQPLRRIAMAALACLIVSPPVAAVLGLLQPDQPLWIILPFLVGEMVPLAVLAALLGMGMAQPGWGVPGTDRVREGSWAAPAM